MKKIEKEQLAHTPEKIDIAIKQLEKEILTISDMKAVDYVVDICVKNSYRQAYVFYLKYRFLNVQKRKEEAKLWLERTIEQAKTGNDHDLYMKSLLAQGELEYEKGKYQAGVKIWMECLEYAVKLGSDDISGYILMNIGKVYFAINNYDIAKTYQERAWEIALKTNNNILKAAICVNLAVVCLELSLPNDALKHIIEGEKYIEQLNNKNNKEIKENNNSHQHAAWYIELMINLGRTKAQLGLYDEAIVMLRFIYNNNITEEFKWQKMICELNLGKIYFDKNDFSAATHWFEKALISSQILNATHMEMNIYKCLYNAYIEEKNYRLALKYYTHYITSYEGLFKVDERQVLNQFDEEMRNIIYKSQLIQLNMEFI